MQSCRCKEVDRLGKMIVCVCVRQKEKKQSKKEKKYLIRLPLYLATFQHVFRVGPVPHSVRSAIRPALAAALGLTFVLDF